MTVPLGENEEAGEGEDDYGPEFREEVEDPLPDDVETEEELDFDPYDESEELRRDEAGPDEAHPGEDSQM